jgi:hypothetical protein
MTARRKARGTVRWLILVLLFAQAAVAANACLAAASARVDAVAAALHEGCDMQQDNPNLCLYHCGEQYNNASTPEPSVFVPSLLALLAPAAVMTAAPPARDSLAVNRATGPPLPIRHCNLRI